ncbi:MAG: hypothetical protein E7Z87_05295 [Cyanobacteria bacterium SIG26]|nr:hypothetical protein [Cyanobacteria bacterium SIG26]
MGFSNRIKPALETLGKKCTPTYVVVAVATAKGIFRPLFTMMDKKESPETKKYTALREGMTEVVAIPTYLFFGQYLPNQAVKLIKDPAKQVMARHNTSFIGVCTAALLVIPALCSITVKPFTDRIFNKNKGKDIVNASQKLDVISPSTEPQVKTPITQTGNLAVSNRLAPYKPLTIANFMNTGMRVS